jgi:hypothetical protein
MALPEGPKKTRFPKFGGTYGDTFMPPETMGKMKGSSPWDFSIDELIEYKKTGVKPKRILDVDTMYALAKCGVSLANVAGLFDTSIETISQTPTLLTAHQNGRAECGSKIRAMIFQHAENGSLDAAKYLDKLMSGEGSLDPQVNVNINTRPLEQVPTSNLIDLILTERDPE